MSLSMGANAGTDDGGSNDLPAVRRMAATLELYNFVLHGEQRDGIFGHGRRLVRTTCRAASKSPL